METGIDSGTQFHRLLDPAGTHRQKVRSMLKSSPSMIYWLRRVPLKKKIPEDLGSISKFSDPQRTWAVILGSRIGLSLLDYLMSVLDFSL